MTEALSLGLANLLSPMILFFGLGFAAALARSDLSIPEALAKGLALYLMLAIGFKGGVALRAHGFGPEVLLALFGGAALALIMPLIAFALLSATTRLSRVDAAAIAAHYGSISVVTFVTASEFLRMAGTPYGGYMVATMALMETPAIIIGLWLARRGMAASDAERGVSGELWREVLLNGSVVLLMGAFVIGFLTGEKGMAQIAPFIEAPFKGVLCLFLLDMGLIAATRLRQARGLTPPLLAFGLYMPILGGTAGVCLGSLLGLSVGSTTLLGTLAASASYIAVPAAMRLALPEANPAYSLSLSLAITFPFNLVAGIPAYHALALALGGG